MRIPQDARTGTYPVFVTVEFDEGFERVTEEYAIRVVGLDTMMPPPGMEQPPVEEPVKERTVITIGPETQDAARGEGGAIFPITIQNEGRQTKSYTIGITGAEEFATVRISPSNLVMVDGGETKVVYIFVAAREGTSVGPHLFNMEVRAGDQVLEQIPLTLNVVEPQERATGMGTAVKVLFIILIVLVIAGLIGASVWYYQQGRKEKGEPEMTVAQTYY